MKDEYYEVAKNILESIFRKEVYNKNNLGIPGNGFSYQNLSDNQDAITEFYKTQDFLEKIFLNRVLEEAPELFDPNMKVEFINYGDTQQVYVLTANNKQWSILVTQPAIFFGIGKNEYDNLNGLSVDNPQLIAKPKYYFCDDDRELYVAPYVYQARCIASQERGYGVYVPEPYYRFEVFTDDVKKIVNTCIIANLVKLYDEDKGQGIGACRIGGGDFILEKSWDDSDKSIKSTLEKMKLIAAREIIKMSLADYEQQLLVEFSNRTYYSKKEDRDPSFLINHKNRVPMTFEEISDGIELGRLIRKSK